MYILTYFPAIHVAWSFLSYLSFFKGQGERFWIGAVDFDGDRQFQWLNGGCDMNDVNGFQGWGISQPSYTADEHCVLFKTASSGQTAWHDTACDREVFSLCAYAL